MRGNLPTREPEILERWRREGLYDRLLAAREGNERYLLHDGPPYANGDVHLGTALNKIIIRIFLPQPHVIRMLVWMQLKESSMRWKSGMPSMSATTAIVSASD
jgi:hypothetical protein